MTFPTPGEDTRESEHANVRKREPACARAYFSVMYPRRVLLVLVVCGVSGVRNAGAETRSGQTDGAGIATSVNIGKCCEPGELLLDDRCTPLPETNETEWRPEFVAEARDAARSRSVEPRYELKIGRPRCSPNEHQWHVYYYPAGPDRLAILPTGVLRHYIVDLTGKMVNGDVYGAAMPNFDGDDDDERAAIHYDYPFGHYCADKVVLTGDQLVATYAMLCVPDVTARWTDTDYLMRRAIDPAFHAVSMACYLIVAVVYFVLPQLRDLVGNIISSMALCLVANQCASTVRIFTEFGNHVSFMIAGTFVFFF